MAQRPRRQFGEVSRLPSGKYRARYTGPDGRRHKAPSTFYTRDDATIWLRTEQRLIEFNEWTSPEQRARKQQAAHYTVGAWLTHWLEIQDQRLKPSTMQNYRATLHRRILDIDGPAGKLRDIPLGELSRRDVAEWWDAVNARFGYQEYNRAAYKRLKTALAAAVERGLVEHNPVSLRDTAKGIRAERKQLASTEQLKAVVKHLPERYLLVGVLTFFHGLRIGEALALRRKDFEWVGERLVVHVRGNVFRVPGEGMKYQDSAKTSAGNRVVPIFEHFHPQVEEHLRRWVGTDPDAWVFTTGEGRLVMDTSYRSVLQRAKTAAGVDVKITPHYGRVWMITTLVEAGMTIPAIGEILGQRDLKTITEVYMRTSEERKRQALEKAGEVFGGV
ncbi:tyrosine-type recombinase/integrase [Corynebacterium sp. TAE3-ERU2]|uniref:tyrosine-type recombinase/integrase n=1 Tax=Corynebacterium sp. TAE3-ERU2 TaxID=2849497 RepID=UPI001C439C57|nr:tyrosine-type recombinase/integrase [Corynebacterium sp. TAE3-ERU2]MBV7302911.1 site-specific integrase [Corynebacterium sp. TAE3-ERU2]